ncbi:MAG: hypothetical protein C0518_04830 [Opitutus sp.]|nr:hypothetical protein [Opitutus sp.]
MTSLAEPFRESHLPPPAPAAGRYAAHVMVDGWLFLSGQFPRWGSQLRYAGRVGAELTEDEASHAARLAALNVLAQIRAALGGFERVVSLARVEGHVAAAPDWNNAPAVLDHASQVFGEALGERGRHARSAFVALRLPLDATVELVVTVRVRPAADPGALP